MTTNWIRASEAVKRLSSYQGGDGAAAQLIEERLTLGLLTGRALRRIETRPRFQRPDEAVVIEVEEVPSWMWAAAARDEYAQRTFDWRGERYTAWKVDHPKDRSLKLSKVEFVGLEFREDQIAQMLPANVAAPTASPASKGGNRGGAPRNEAGWDRFWMALLELCHEGRLTAAHFTSQADLRRELLVMTNDALSEASIKPKVSQVWKKLQIGPGN